MKLEIGVVDAFTDEVFGGNPAAVCLLEQELSAETMQKIAMEMNLSETAFVQKKDIPNHFSLRWFTPTLEIDLCGHATLASAFWMLRNNWAQPGETIHFHTLSGELQVKSHRDQLEMNFPLLPTFTDTHPVFKDELFGKKILAAAQLRKNWIFELESEDAVKTLEPSMQQIADNSEEGFIVTAAGDGEFDIVSRFFGPNVGVAEDPVTGFAHCALMDYWYQKTGKLHLKAFQASNRGGKLDLEKQDDRVILRGKAVSVLTGTMTLD